MRVGYQFFTIFFPPLTFFPRRSNSNLFFTDDLSGFIQKWHAIGSGCVCDTFGFNKYFQAEKGRIIRNVMHRDYYPCGVRAH